MRYRPSENLLRKTSLDVHLNAPCSVRGVEHIRARQQYAHGGSQSLDDVASQSHGSACGVGPAPACCEKSLRHHRCRWIGAGMGKSEGPPGRAQGASSRGRRPGPPANVRHDTLLHTCILGMYSCHRAVGCICLHCPSSRQIQCCLTALIKVSLLGNSRNRSPTYIVPGAEWQAT